MKILSILRHGKSSWDFPDLSDFERPLLTKGVKRTLRVCNALTDAKIIPDRVISSKAKRALETANIVIEKLNVPLHHLLLNDQFYPGSTNHYLDEIFKTNNNIKHLMIVGHNPGLTDLASTLLNKSSIDWIPSSGLVHIEFNCDNWEDIDLKNAKMLNYFIPKELKKTNI